MSKAMGVVHVLFTILNAVLCVTSLGSGRYGAATVSGVLAAILVWQLTW
jgi:hypothetical protein